MVSIDIDKALCNSCGACIKACTFGYVFKMNGGSVPSVEPARCRACGHCVAACPTGAIVHSRFRLEDCPVIESSKLPDRTSLTYAFQKRRANRAFQDRPIPREIVERLLGTSAHAPSAHNGQPVDWLVIDSRNQIKNLSNQTIAILVHMARLLLNPLVDFSSHLTRGHQEASNRKSLAVSLLNLEAIRKSGGDPIFYDAPVVAVAHVPAGSYFGRDDAIYGLYNVELIAERIDLGTCQIGYFKLALDRSASLRKALQLPEGRSAEAAIVVGYPSIAYRRALPRRKPGILWSNSLEEVNLSRK